jgi:hypothetical protein
MTTFNASYMGLALFGNLWSIVALIKHIVIVVMIIMAIYAYEGLARKVSKLAVKGPSPASTGFILGVIVLLLTGVMTAISATS